MNPTDPQSPIEYDLLEIPGRGTFTVKFDFVAQYWLDKNMKMTTAQFSKALQEFLPKFQTDTEGQVLLKDGIPVMLSPGEVHPAFLFDLLSACLWTELELTGVQLAGCFKSYDSLPAIVRAIGTAFVKTQWSAKVKLQEPATQLPEPPKPN